MTASRETVGIIGLGIMGGTMAERLIAEGYKVVGYDVSAARRTALGQSGGQAMRSNAAVAARADILVLSLPHAAALHAVTAELATVAPAKRGQVVLETSTLTLHDKAQAAQALRRQGRQMLDAPISGTATSEPHKAWIMYLSGPAAACKRAASVVRCFTLQAPRVGAFGHGTKLKFAANHLVGIYNVAYAEMVALCRKMGLDPAIALEHMGHSPYLGTGAMRIRMPMMIDRAYQPATMKVEVWQKDMKVITDMARDVGCATPLLNACAAIYTSALAQGMGQHDTASVAEVLAKLSGVGADGAPRDCT